MDDSFDSTQNRIISKLTDDAKTSRAFHDSIIRGKKCRYVGGGKIKKEDPIGIE